MIKLLLYLFRTCRRDILLVVVLGILGGGSSAIVIAVVNSVLHGRGSGALLPAGFAAAALIKIATALLSNLLLLHMVEKCGLQLCDQLCRLVMAAPLRRIEEVGTPRILASLTDDVSTLSGAIHEVPQLAINSAVLMGCASYLAWLSWRAAAIMFAIVIAGGFGYGFLLNRVRNAFERARDGRDVLFRHFRSLTEGIKEFKLSRLRRDAFFSQDLDPAVQHLRKYNLIAVKLHILASGWSQLVFYSLLALLLFVMLPTGVVDQKALTAYVFVALFTTAPLWAVIAALPALSRGRTALDRIEAVERLFDEHSDQSDPASNTRHECPRLEFEQVRFAYADSVAGVGFALGPLDLALVPGELVFVTGGNGSGKSTFVKVLTGLYSPISGNIRLDGQCVTSNSREAYRELFSVVYSDFYLFDRLVGMNNEELQRRAYEYLVTLKLDHKVRVVGNTLSTTALSQGQRRRLALLMAYLEDRPIYVLDEWAADQDPTFRDLFYTRLLPELKRRGKAVVVVTHDDRYYHLGDRIISLDYGKICNNGQEIPPVLVLKPSGD